jgi:hypothetical protein
VVRELRQRAALQVNQGYLVCNNTVTKQESLDLVS